MDSPMVTRPKNTRDQVIWGAVRRRVFRVCTLQADLSEHTRLAVQYRLGKKRILHDAVQCL
eukprot:1941051-Pyramimonas_sp.AAC.1